MHRADPPEFVLLGGSFNPVHAGHVEILRQVAALPGVAQVLAVPAARSPFKGGAELLPAALRYRLLRDAAAGLERVAVLDWELRRPPPSPSYETVAALRAAYPAARLRFALGADAFADFARWERAAALLELAGLLVFPRAQEPGGNGAPALPDPRALPAPWPERVQRAEDGHLDDAAGRRVVRYEPLRIPALAATDILRARDLAHVPPPARAALEAHWQSHPESRS